MDPKLDVHGQACQDYHYQNKASKLFLNNDYGPPDRMVMEVFFRDELSISELEEYALSLCSGKVLDIGAGVGSSALILQQRGLEVTAMEISPKLTDIMKNRGVKRVVKEDVFKFRGQKFDTILLMMNGIGVVGTLAKFEQFLIHLKDLLYSGGQVLFDSSDIRYLYKKTELPMEHYYGEIKYQFQYEDQKGKWFYIDQELLIDLSTKHGWITQIIYQDANDQYLARLIKKV
ncbi:MAG: methyltransferase domain-containing protein [Bacteroidetes bacterium]|nr:methyltransferase domain-containing protein [Bacteroidota bacterium]